MRKDRVGSQLGTVTVIPSEALVVGRGFRVEITYTVGSAGIEIGGAIRFKLPGLTLGPDKPAPICCSNPQVELTCANRIDPVNGKSGVEFRPDGYLFVVVEGARLNEGDSLTIQYGDQISTSGVLLWGRSTAPTPAPQVAQRWPVEVAIDPDGSRSAPGSGFYLVEHPPFLHFVNDDAGRIEVFIPSCTCVGVNFRTTVRLLDRYSNLVEDYTGTVLLEEQTAEGVVSVGECRFEAHHKGVFETGGTAFNTPGIHRITARDKTRGISALSNPTKTREEAASHSVFWGDIHCQLETPRSSTGKGCRDLCPLGSGTV